VRYVAGIACPARETSGGEQYMPDEQPDFDGAHLITDVLRRLADATSATGATGADAYRRTVRDTAELLGVAHCFVAALSGDANASFSTLAVWSGGRFGAAAQYSLAGTPTAEVIASAAAHHERNAERIKCEPAFAEAAVGSYFGVPLLDSGGDVMGVLAVADDKPLHDTDVAGAVLRIMAAHIAAELERRDVERALVEMEARYRWVVDDSFNLSIEIQEGRVVRASRQYAETLGFSPDELLGSSAVERVHPDDRRGIFGERQKMAAERRAGSFHFRIQHRDGSWLWFEAVARLLATNGSVRTVVFGRDVTGAHREADALRESETRFRTLIDELDIGVLVQDGAGQVTLFNRAALALLGLAPDQLLGHTSDHPDWDIIHEDGSPCPSEHHPVSVALATKQPVRGVAMGIKNPKTQVRLWLLLSAEPRVAVDGCVEQVVVTFSDITAQIESRTALEKSEATSRALLNAPAHSAVLLERDGTIVALNVSATARFEKYAAQAGIDTSGGFAGMCVFDLFPPRVREQRRMRNESVFETGQRARYEDEQNGAWADSTIDPVFDGEGRIIRLAVFSRDITERKRDEEYLREHSEELEALNSSLAAALDDLARSERELSEKSAQLEERLLREREYARFDALTAVLNHGAITELLRDRLTDAAPCGVAIVDVDGMKAVNDTFGHRSGDALLREVARALEHDGAIAGRYGGDEFLVVLPGADRARSEAYVALVRGALAAANVVDPETGARVPVVASVGIALCPDDGTNLAALVEMADVAMYREKRERNSTSAASLSDSRAAGDEQAAQAIGELVPLLTSAGSVEEKLRLVAHRLSVGCGYDAANFEIFDAEQGQTIVQNTFMKAPQDVIDAWRLAQRESDSRVVQRILRETHRPVFFDETEHDERIPEAQRALLAAVGIRSGISVPLLWQGEVLGAMSIGSKRLAGFTERDGRFLMSVAAQVTAIIRMAELVERLASVSTRLSTSRDEMVMVLGAAAEEHSSAGGYHLSNVRALSEAIAVELGYGAGDAYELGLAAALHDIGKLQIPDALLSSPLRLDSGDAGMAESIELLKRHCVWGAEFLGAVSGMELAALVAYSHHERWDGTGYPDGLAGDAIPLAATIVALADSLDTMVTGRHYQPARSLDEALEEALRCRGTHFSPAVVDALVRLYDRGVLRPIVAYERDEAA
jgi:diguanylate cyclase (GGDEF)-like protein/PAS domain S-box-containing protein